MVTACGGKNLYSTLSVVPDGQGTNTINSEILEANPLVACSLDQWRIPSVRVFAAS